MTAYGTLKSSYPIDQGECVYIDANGRSLHRSYFNLDWIDNPKCVLDVGAWDFGDSVRIKQRFPKCKVHSFELLPKNCQIYAPYAMSQGVFTYNIGITDKCGLFEYYESIHNSGDNAQSTLLEPDKRYIDNYGGYVKHQKVTLAVYCETIKNFCQFRDILPHEVDLLHLDVEGNEYNVFKGLGDIRPKMIFAEFLLNDGWKNQGTFQESIDFLESIGYTLAAEFPFDKLFVYTGGKINVKPLRYE